MPGSIGTDSAPESEYAAQSLARVLRLLGGAALATVGLACSVSFVDLEAGLPNLRPGEAVVLLHLTTDLRIESLGVGGRVVEGAWPQGEHLRAILLPVGRHSWSNAMLPERSGRIAHIQLSHGDGTTFEVREGQLNYPGHLAIERIRDDSSAVRIASRNRIARVIQALSVGGLLDRLGIPLRYTGHSRDDFSEYYESERARQRAAAGDAERASRP